MNKQRLQELAGIIELSVNEPVISEKEAIRLSIDTLIKNGWEDNLERNVNMYEFLPEDVNPKLVKYLENLPVEDYILDFKIGSYKATALITTEDDDDDEEYERTIVVFEVNNYD